MDQDTVQALFSAFIVVATMLLVGFPVHEALHAWTAMKLGDNTARFMGRVTLDPRAHFDQFGALVLAGTAIFSAIGPGGILFGWAKPTPVNPMNMRHGRQGHALVAFAGPASNLVVAVLAAIVSASCASNLDVWNVGASQPAGGDAAQCGLAAALPEHPLFIFNLLPVPPLDGWSVLKGIVPVLRQPGSWRSSRSAMRTSSRCSSSA